MDVYDYKWVSNTRLVYYVMKDKRYFVHLTSINRDLKEKKLVQTTFWATIVDGILSDPDHAYVWKYYQSKYSILGLMNIHNGRIRKKERIRSSILWINTDFNGTPNLISTYKKKSGGNPKMSFRESRDAKWTPLQFDDDDYMVYCCTPQDNTKLYISTYNKRNTRSLYIYDTNNFTLGEQLLSDSAFDFHGNLYFFDNPYTPPDRAKLRGVIYNNQYPVSYWFDDKLQTIQKKVDNELTHSANLIIDADTSLTLFLIKSYSDIKPAEYYLYNTDSDDLYLLFKSRPWINPYNMVQTLPVNFITRDSLVLHGYFTKPRCGTAPYPTIALLHGGPHARDYWGFDPEVQLLANRGYAVLQVNYRGSTGYGYRISQENKFEYKKMYLDVIDAANCLIRDVIADPKLITVMGASFGGYLSITCVANEPDLFRCAVSNAGVFDWKKHVRSKKFKYSDYAYDFFKANLGGDDNKNYLKEISPIHKAKNIKVPVFLGGGSDDRNVSISQSFKLSQILSRNGVEVETFFKSGEGHGFAFKKNLVIFYERVLDFLNRNMNSEKKNN